MLLVPRLLSKKVPLLPGAGVSKSTLSTMGTVSGTKCSEEGEGPEPPPLPEKEEPVHMSWHSRSEKKLFCKTKAEIFVISYVERQHAALAA